MSTYIFYKVELRIGGGKMGKELGLRVGAVQCGMLRVSELLNRTFDCSDFISVTNDRESFIIEMRSEPLNARSDDLDMHSTLLRTPLHSSVPN